MYKKFGFSLTNMLASCPSLLTTPRPLTHVRLQYTIHRCLPRLLIVSWIQQRQRYESLHDPTALSLVGRVSSQNAPPLPKRPPLLQVKTAVTLHRTFWYNFIRHSSHKTINKYREEKKQKQTDQSSTAFSTQLSFLDPAY